MAYDGGSLRGCLVIGGLVAALYLNSITGDFVFDDHEAIETNVDVRVNTPLKQVFSNDFWGNPMVDSESHKSYRPLVILSFRLNRLVHGLWAPGFHFVNIVLHSIVSILYCWMLCSLGVERSAIVTAGLLFATHPIHTEAVSNIVGRTELLAALFFILSFLLYHHTLPHTQSRPSSHSLLSITLPLLPAVCSLLCKEQGITVLAVCLLYDLVLVCQLNLVEMLQYGGMLARWLYCKVKGHKIRRGLPRWLILLTQRILLLIMSTIIIVGCRLYLNGRGRPFFVESDNPASFSTHFLTRALTYSYLSVLNVWLLLCPSWLCFDWSMGSVLLVRELMDLRNIATCLLFGTLLVFAFWSSGISKNRALSSIGTSNGFGSFGDIPDSYTTRDADRGIILFSLGLIVLPYLPASNLFFPVGFVVAERVLYLPSMGFCLLIAIGYSRLKQWSPFLVNSLLVMTLLGFSVKTVLRNGDWRSIESLASSAVPVNPGNAKVFMTLATHYTQLGQRRCELFYREAIRLRPNYTAAWTNLGLVMLNTDRPNEAEKCYQKALSIKPDHINANINMGHLCRIQERWREASLYYEKALQRKPHNFVVNYNLGLMRERMGGAENLQRAEQAFKRALQLQPGHWESQAALAGLLATTTAGGRRVQYGLTTGKRLDQAIHRYQMALSLKPDQSNIRYNLSRAFAFKGRLEDAKAELKTVLQLSPQNQQAHYDLGSIYERLGDRDKALKAFYTAHQLDPTSSIVKEKIKDLS